MGIGYLIFALLFSISTHAQVFDDAQISQLKSTILQSTQTLHSADGTSQFNGSYDWHSDVHAHWALLSISRLTGDSQLDAKVTSILTLERIKNEYKFLNSNNWSSFEQPYGRAWFLLMLSELNLRPIGQDPNFQKIRRTMTVELLKWLKENPFPDAGNSFVGTHSSWLMALFLTKLASRDYADLESYFDQLIDKKIFPVASKIDSVKFQDGDFIFLPSLRQLVLPKTDYVKDVLAIPKPKKFLCHTPGAIQISYWAHASECAKHDAKSCVLIEEKSGMFFDRKDLWKTDFDCVSHWVPQFMWMTHWLSLGTP